MPHHPDPAAAAPPGTDRPAYQGMIEAYDRRTRAAYEVMGARWGRFLQAKAAFLAAEHGSREWYAAAEHAYRLGLRSTHAYYLWTIGHTALALETLDAGAERRTLRLRLLRELQSPPSAGPLRMGAAGAARARE